MVQGLASVTSGLPLFIPLIYGLILGVMIEFVTSVVFKAGVQSMGTISTP